jgi:hypothetical protein
MLFSRSAAAAPARGWIEDWDTALVVKTGARVEALRWILRLAGRVELTAAPSAPRLETLPAETAELVMDLYRRLGGIQESPRLAPGPWDVAYSDGLLLELDEDLHFHRYRGTTLGAPWAECSPGRCLIANTSETESAAPESEADGGRARLRSGCSAGPTRIVSSAYTGHRDGSSGPFTTP